MELPELNTIATVGTFAAVVVAVVFGAIQARHNSRNVRRQATWDILSSFFDSDVRRAYPIIRDLPDACDPHYGEWFEWLNKKLGPDPGRRI